MPALSLLCPLRQKGGSYSDLNPLWLRSQALAIAQVVFLRQQFTDCQELQMLRHCLESSILKEICYDGIYVGVSGGKAQSAPDPRRWKMHTVGWSGEENKWSWLRLLCLSNEEKLCGIPIDPAATLNKELIQMRFLFLSYIVMQISQLPSTCTQLWNSI